MSYVPPADGEAEVAAQATGLEDGMHTATVEVLDEGGIPIYHC